MVPDTTQEAATSTIDLADDEPYMVAKMIDFLYRAQYDDIYESNQGDASAAEDIPSQIGNTTAGSSLGAAENTPPCAQEPGSSLITHAWLYILGDKYDIPSLKELASRKYTETASTGVLTKFFPESAKLIYDNVVAEKDVLKLAIYKTACSNISKLITVP